MPKSNFWLAEQGGETHAAISVSREDRDEAKIPQSPSFAWLNIWENGTIEERVLEINVGEL